MFDWKRKVIACAVVAEELRAKLPAEIECETLEFGLHRTPQALKTALQEAINNSEGYDELVLGYGLCGMAVVGLCSNSSTLIIPRADDCITIFLGSREAFRAQQRNHPGSLFLTKGWLDGGKDDDTPSLQNYTKWVEKYGEERAKRLRQIYLRDFKRLAFIKTGESKLDEYRERAQKRAEYLNLRYDEIPGSTVLVEKIADGLWDDDFVVISPGNPVTFEDFWPLSNQKQ